MREKKLFLKYVCFAHPKNELLLKWQGDNYKIILIQDSESRYTALSIYNLALNKKIDLNILRWLSLYFGEDFTNPHSIEDNRFVWWRGTFNINLNQLQTFLTKCEKLPFKSHAIWKQEAFDLSLTYYIGGLRVDALSFPAPISLFVTSIETISSIYVGKRENYSNFGNSSYNSLINKRVEKMIQWKPLKRDNILYTKADINQDFELLLELRNSLCAHGLIYQSRKQKKLIELIKDWHIRGGHSKKFAEISFKISRWRKDVGRESWKFYKLALRLNRLVIFHYIGYHFNIPFSSHDWKLNGNSELTNGEIAIKPPNEQL